MRIYIIELDRILPATVTLDTGAGSDFISANILMKLDIKAVDRQARDIQNVQLANGATLVSVAKVTLRFKIDQPALASLTYEADFNVLDWLPVGIVLGYQFLKKYRLLTKPRVLWN